MDIQPIFAVEMPLRQLYLDPAARHHGDVFTRFGLLPKDSVSTGFIINGIYCQKMRALDYFDAIISPEPE